MLNLIEPESLVRHFVAHPPEGMTTGLSDDGVPIFSTHFDLLTTADARLRRKIESLPLDSPLVSHSANSYADELVEAYRRHGCAVLTGQALAYVPIDFDSIDQYLGRLSAARRKDFRRKLRDRRDLKIEIVPTGSETLRDPIAVKELYAMYLNVFRQSSIARSPSTQGLRNSRAARRSHLDERSSRQNRR
jgi:hypothetical protein